MPHDVDLRDLPPPTPALTVRDVLALDVVADAEPEVLGSGDFLKTPVRWVHIAEDADTSRLLEGGELVLTTGLSFRHSAVTARRFLDLFADAGAVAVIVELVDDDGETDQDAVERLRRAARGAAGVVVLLHRRVRFVQITEQVHRRLMDRQVAHLERARHVHEVFTALSLKNADEQQIVDLTSDLVRSPIIFEDAAHLVLAVATAGAPPAKLLEDWQRRSQSIGYSSRTARATVAGATWWQTPVGLPGQRWGRLVIPAGPADETDAAAVLERAGQALTMARMAGRDRRELLHQARAGLLQELRRSPADAEQDARARAASLGLAAAPRYLAAVARLDRTPGEPLTGLQIRERGLLEAIEARAAAAGVPILGAGLHTGAVGLLFAVASVDDEDRTLRDVFVRLDIEGSRWSVGVGPSHPSIVRAARGLEQALQVAEIAATLRGRRAPFYRFGDVRLRGLVALLQDDPRLRSFAQSELGGLLDPLDEPGLRLLERFLHHGGNKSTLARSEFLSRQTLYARLRALEDTLGSSLDDAESRAALHLAVLWYRLAGRIGPAGGGPTPG